MKNQSQVALRKESVDRNIMCLLNFCLCQSVALRKESVDRNFQATTLNRYHFVALRKESVDRNKFLLVKVLVKSVALRKESVDRNIINKYSFCHRSESLSARRAWIEISPACAKKIGRLVALRKESVDRNVGVAQGAIAGDVALRKESVDRNTILRRLKRETLLSLSARRAWIEISTYVTRLPRCQGRSPQGERG